VRPLDVDARDKRGHDVEMQYSQCAVAQGGRRSLDRQLHLFARLQAVVRAQSIEHPEALERMI